MALNCSFFILNKEKNMITVVRESMLSKKANQMDLDITPEQYSAWVNGAPAT